MITGNATERVVVVDRRLEMGVFDALPQVLRDEIRAGVLEYSAVEIARDIVRAPAFARDLVILDKVDQIRRENREKHSRRDLQARAAMRALGRG